MSLETPDDRMRTTMANSTYLNYCQNNTGNRLTNRISLKQPTIPTSQSINNSQKNSFSTCKKRPYFNTSSLQNKTTTNTTGVDLTGWLNMISVDHFIN